MHYVQLFNAVDPVLAHLQATGGGLPPAAELQTAAGALHQFATQARGLPSQGSDGATVDRLATASSSLAGELTTLAAKGSLSSDATSGLTAAMAEFQSAAASARQATGLPAVKTSPPKPQADTGP
jgi:hypothetical protein